MTLVTRCPTCGTAFRVQPGQLSARAGKVRCGKCGTVFNGVAALVEEERAGASREPSPQLALFEAGRRPPPAPKAPTAVEPQLVPPPMAAADASPEPTLRLEPIEPAAHMSSPPQAAAPPSQPVSTSEPAAAPTPARAPPAAAEASPAEAVAEASPEPEAVAVPDFLAVEAPARRRLPFRIAWALASSLAVLALTLQVLLQYRADVLARFPQTRPLLTALCAPLGCAVLLPRRPDLMSIESSDLQADPKRAGVIALDAVIRNRASYAQEYPSLELTLTDDQQRALVRRVLMPSDYLAPRRATLLLDRGIAAHGDAEVHVYFDTGRVHPTGYRVYLFYP